MTPPDCLQPSLWVDLFKTFAGVFTGATLAFLANIRIQGLQRERSNLAAGNMAIAILSRQYGDFAIFRAGLKQELAEKCNWPGWLQIKPTIFQLSDNLKFDLPSLAFLSEGKHHDLLTKLLIAEVKYHDLRHIHTLCAEACIERDKSLSEAGLSDLSLEDLHRAENSVDCALQAKCEALNQFLQQRANQDENFYKAAGNGLHKMMSARFKSGTVMPFSAIGARDDIIT